MCEERRDTVFEWLTEGGTKPDLTVPTEDNKHIFDDQPGGTSLEELTKEHLKVVQGRVPLPSSKARRGISHAPVTSSRASSGPRTEIPLLPPRGVDAASQMVLPRRNGWSGPPGGRAFLDYEPSMSSDQALGWFEQTNPELQELTHTSLLAPDSRRATHLPTPPHHATNSGQWTSHSQHTQPRTPTHSPTPTQSCQQTTNTHANQTTGNRKRKTGQTKHKQNDTTQHRVLKTGQHYPPRVKKEMRIDRALEGRGRTW